MNKQDAWLIIYGGILSIRYHPKNDTHRDQDDQVAELAARAADAAIKQWEKRQ